MRNLWQRLFRALPFFSSYLGVVAVLSIFLLHGVQVWRIGYVDRLDAWIYDARLQAHAPRTQDPNVVIVDIDEPSLSAFGRWPWARDITAALVQRLITEQGVSVIGFDMVFAEAESPSTDSALALTLRHQPIVLGYYFTSDRANHTSGTLPAPVFNNSHTSVRDFQVTHWNGYGANLSELAEAAPQAGFFNAISDIDGTIRSAPLLGEFRGEFYESLSLALYRRYLARIHNTPTLPNLQPHFATQRDYPHLQGLHLSWPDAALASHDIDVDETVNRLIPFRGPGGPSGGSFRYISAADVLLGRLPAQSLEKKIVLIGSSAPTLEDLRVTPFGSTFPGVEVQANLLSGLIRGEARHRPDYALGFEVFQLTVVGLSLLFLLPQLGALWAIALSLGWLAVMWLGHGYAFSRLGIVLPSASALCLVLCAFVAHASHGFLVEGQRRRHLTQLFGNYVSPQWVKRMVRSEDKYSMKASHQVLTIMFCDMRGFTQLSQTMSPLALQALLNHVFDKLSLIIQEHGGTIDKYMGDCVMAFWGAPEPQADHATRAVRCALQMQAAIDAMNIGRHADEPSITMGIGINTGLVCVGDMGSSLRRSYTVIGEAVNVASRLEGLCKTYNCPIIVSAATVQATTFRSWHALGLASIAGSDQPVSIFTLSAQAVIT